MSDRELDETLRKLAGVRLESIVTKRTGCVMPCNNSSHRHPTPGTVADGEVWDKLTAAEKSEAISLYAGHLSYEDTQGYPA